MAPVLKEKTMTPFIARKGGQRRNTESLPPRAWMKTPSGEVNTEASMRTPTASTMMRKTKKWRPPMRISWPSGIRKVADRTGQRTYLRGSKKINAMAMSMATNTMGCRTVSEAPPPNLRFSGCIRVSPCEAECSSGTHAAGKGRPRDTDIGSTGSKSRATRGRHLEVGCSVQSCGLLHLPSVGSYTLTTLAGLPATALHGGTLLVTTEFAPMTLL